MIALPSIVVTATALRSRSARGSGTTGPSPRQTAAVGTSSRIWLKAQRVCGKRELDPSPKRMILSGGGGKPCMKPSVTGSL